MGPCYNMGKMSPKYYVLLSIAYMAIQLLFQSCETGKKMLVQGYAFYTLPASGIVMADEKGNGVTAKADTAFFLYLDAVKKLSFDSVWFEGRVFTGTTFLFNKKEVEAGLNSEKQPVVIKVDSSHFLYRLQLNPVALRMAPRKTEPGEILLRFNHNDKKHYRNFTGFRKLEIYSAQ